MISLDDVLQMDGTVFAVWLQENRKKCKVDCERLGRYLGVETEAIEGYEKGYCCRGVYREALFKYFEEKERLRLERYSTKTEPQTNSCLFGSWLKKQRLALGMTQKEFAAAIGVPTAPQISVYEHGRHLPSEREQTRIKDRVKDLFESRGYLSKMGRKSPALRDRVTRRDTSALPSETVEVSVEKAAELSASSEELPSLAKLTISRQSIDRLINQWVCRLNEKGVLKLCSFLFCLLRSKENIEPCFVDADD